MEAGLVVVDGKYFPQQYWIEHKSVNQDKKLLRKNVEKIKMKNKEIQSYSTGRMLEEDQVG